MNFNYSCTRISLAALLLLPFQALSADFVSSVTTTHPIAFYQLGESAGKSLVGSTEYRSIGGVSAQDTSGPIGSNRFLKFDGHNGYVLTTQAGGVGVAASLMAWVNLANLPSQESRIFYVAGESQYGNDLDLQIENDNVLRFFTASGGRLEYAPPVGTLINQWHLIVATMDAASQTRSIFWDGKLVATDKGGGKANKTGALSIGASTVFGGRFFDGGIAGVALWNRALKPSEVAGIYQAASSGSPTNAKLSSSAGSIVSPFPTTAKVEVGDNDGPVKVNRAEQIAIVFLSAFEMIERDCQDHAKRACTLDEMLAGPVGADGFRIYHLKFDPRKDPNYTYTVAASGTAWEAHANAKKPGLIGFCWMSRSFPNANAFYNPSGIATVIDKELGNRSIEGDTFSVP